MLPCSFIQLLTRYLFLNFFLNPIRPARPDPSRSMVAGSGTGAGVAVILLPAPPLDEIHALNVGLVGSEPKNKSGSSAMIANSLSSGLPR